MPYIYRVKRHEAASPLTVNPAKGGVVVTGPISAETLEATAADLVAVDEPSYRDLQAQAQEAGIKANQSADKLKKALGAGNG